jgi:gamma-glutamyltranspeptidase/glutathione hydrolase
LNKLSSTLTLSVICFFLVSCSSDGVTVPAISGDDSSPGMVVTANPLASQAGAEIIAAGGSAVDAAIAIEAVLSLVEPQSSGLGGGGFMVHFENSTNTLSVYDGRETAPASATSDRFLVDGGKMDYLDAKHSGLSTGVPGVVSMLQLAHADHGLLSWGENFALAKKLAVDGFAVSPRLHGMIQRFGKYLPSQPGEGPTDAFDYLHTAEGEPLPIGHILKSPDYAAALDIIASDPDDFYQGKLAQQIVEKVNKLPRAGGMSMADMRAYSAQRESALCMPYKALRLCGPPPPSSWLAVAMIMGILEKAPEFSRAGADDPKNWALFGEAQRLAYADRDHFVADSQQVMVPIAGLLHPDYLGLRASEISTAKAKPAVGPGDPWAFSNPMPLEAGIDATVDVAGTTHFVVVDKAGNVVSMTASVESIFGSARMVGGMFLNNQLTDFSFLPNDESGKPIANSVAPGKRPRSSMSPTIVLDAQGEFKMATGSPGGNSIIAYTAKTLLGVLEWGLSAQQAVNLPNLVGRGDTIRIEQDRANQQLIDGLRAYGFNVKESAGENSGLSVVYKNAVGDLEGGVDPRREGVIEIVF